MLSEVYLRYLRVQLLNSPQKVTISIADSNNIRFLMEIKNGCSTSKIAIYINVCLHWKILSV